MILLFLPIITFAFSGDEEIIIERNLLPDQIQKFVEVNNQLLQKNYQRLFKFESEFLIIDEKLTNVTSRLDEVMDYQKFGRIQLTLSATMLGSVLLLLVKNIRRRKRYSIPYNEERRRIVRKLEI